MGIFDRAKDVVGDHAGRADRGVDPELDAPAAEGPHAEPSGETAESAPQSGNDPDDNREGRQPGPDSTSQSTGG